MKVSDVRVQSFQAHKKGAPVRDALQILSGGGSVLVTISTDEGCSGQSKIGFGRISGASITLAGLIENELKPIVLGRDLAYVRGIHEEMLKETEYHGSCGIAMFGISAIDTALWDCIGKARGVPCWQMWGAVHERIPAYCMIGWMNYSEKEFQEKCRQAVSQGFKALKIKVGYPTLKEDLHRIGVVRKAVGTDIRLMVDANQSLSLSEALIRGKAFQEEDIYWWEEPLPADDIEGYAHLADRLEIPVATGENLYSPADFARFLKRDAVDIVQPDLRRGGGPTALLQIGLMAAAFRKPYASHGGGAVHLNVMACLPNALYLETGLIAADAPYRLEDGCVRLPAGPGFSFLTETAS